MNRVPKIVTVTRRHNRKDKWVQYTGELHLDQIFNSGALPILVPATLSALPCLEEYKSLMDGLLIVEGGDIGTTIHPRDDTESAHLEDVDSAKDLVEWELVNYALENEIPYLGICRGAQMAAVALGGELYSDVTAERDSNLLHINYENYDNYRHRVSIVDGTPLSKWFQSKEISVTSYHHQGIRVLPEELTALCYSEDGLIEGYYHSGKPFLFGIQFHPERQIEDDPGHSKIYKEFVQAVKRFHEGK